jgi:hypothetical protein
MISSSKVTSLFFRTVLNNLLSHHIAMLLTVNSKDQRVRTKLKVAKALLLLLTTMVWPMALLLLVQQLAMQSIFQEISFALTVVFKPKLEWDYHTTRTKVSAGKEHQRSDGRRVA